MGRLFGTDGVRGVANRDLTCTLAHMLGKAGAYVLAKECSHKPRILIGKDTRISSDMLEAALVSGICSLGAEAVILGVIPTPAVAYLVRKYNADAGVVISASHNPFEFNGIKFFDKNGFKLPDSVEEQIEEIVLNNLELPLPTHGELGRIRYIDSAARDYVDFAVSTVDCDLSGMKIAIDCANGASYITSKNALETLGAEVVTINCTPDGININDNCGSTHPEGLQNFVAESGCDLGFAFDGDADRVIAVDHTGAIVDGDRILAICACDLKSRGRLRGNTLVATVMSNFGLFAMCSECGINVAQTQVGDRYVLEEMLKNGYVLGGEQSGHIIFLEHSTTGDGLISALQLLSAVKRSGKTLHENAQIMKVYPQILMNARVRNDKKHACLLDEEIAGEIAVVKERFAGQGRVLIRPSGTEPLVRVMIEGMDIEELKAEAERLVKLIEERMNR